MTSTSLRLAVAICALTSFSVSAHADGRPTIYEGFLAKDDQGDLSTFQQLINEVFRDEDLRRIFDGEDSFTVFAPTNDAFGELFDALSEEELAQLQDLNSGVLERLLRYHVTRGAWRKPTGALRMLDDNVAQTYGEGKAFKIDEAIVEDATRYRNGIVAKINTVISPADEPLPVGTSSTASSHTNNLTFEGADFLRSSGGAHSVTYGQPYGDVTLSGDQLVIVAGRHKSSGPANFFMNGLTADEVLNTTSHESAPSELNFAQIFQAFVVALDGLEFECFGVRFGQGSTPTENNWWVGQENAWYDAEFGNFFLDCNSSKKLCFPVLSRVDHDTSRCQPYVISRHRPEMQGREQSFLSSGLL